VADDEAEHEQAIVGAYDEAISVALKRPAGAPTLPAF
jgi:hypothetical protein